MDCKSRGSYVLISSKCSNSSFTKETSVAPGLLFMAYTIDGNFGETEAYYQKIGGWSIWR